MALFITDGQRRSYTDGIPSTDSISMPDTYNVAAGDFTSIAQKDTKDTGTSNTQTSSLVTDPILNNTSVVSLHTLAPTLSRTSTNIPTLVTSSTEIINPRQLNTSYIYDPLLADLDKTWEAQDIAMLIIQVMAFLVCVIGNTLIFIILLRHRKLRNRTNLLVLSLAIADLLVGMAIIPTEAMLNIPSAHRTDTRLFCTTHKFLVTFPLGCSLLAMLLISIDRYLAIALPFRRVTKRSARISIIISWLLMLILCAPIFHSITSNASKEDSPKTIKNVTCNPADIKPKEYAMIVYFFLLVAFVGNAILYIWVSRVAIRQYQRINIEIGRYTSRTELRNTKAIVITFGVFIVLWSPYMVLLGLYLFDFCNHDSESCALAGRVTLALGIFNSAINCYIYAWQKKDFRWALRQMFCQWRRRRRVSSLNTALTARMRKTSSAESAYAMGNRLYSRRTELTLIASIVHESNADLEGSNTCDLRYVPSSTGHLSDVISNDADFANDNPAFEYDTSDPPITMDANASDV